VSVPQPTAAAPPAPTLSARQLLARTALSAALAVDGVAGATAGRLRTHVTPAGGELLQGITVAATGDGRFGVDLFLVARPVPLHALAERVRDRVRRAARIAGLDAQLGPVNVAFEDVEEPA
jgi:hypothetical protein